MTDSSRNIPLPGFDAEGVRACLPDRLAPPAAQPQLSAYLACYGLSGLAARADYAIGRLELAGTELVVQRFFQPAGAKGTVLLVHGYTDHAGLSRPLLERLFQQGWNLVIYDLPGHGLSAGEPHDVDDFFRYTDQLAALVRQLHAGLCHPLTLIGHSTGGAIILTMLLRETGLSARELNPPVLLAPLVRPTRWRSIRFKYRWLSPWLKRVKRFYLTNSHDPEFLRFVQQEDPLQHPWIAVGWVGAMLTWINWVEVHGPSHWRPLLIQGSEDTTVEWRHNLDVLRRLFPGAEQSLVEGARHHLINETDPWQSEVFEQLLAFIEPETKTPGT
ncbi:alpha/beta hydrolase [Marinobacterium lutimaris]|uniref:Lysophospholipase, alpha-beta hydrolase superfamily n=1 Tax=Marinobacterium lutimaris TaxID=568106 RepID=A0A1H6D9S5_9GAMM|nr:alpha/beta hydrolase [Marinobacterium lutimaris]SEG81958.1 Lysophospholipase, alpha-beta hydrolase superfamily [Marinobacterium lutimaris]